MDLKILLLSLGISRASIIAASNSGRIALDFALKYPDSVESLVLVGSGLGLFDPEGVKGLGEIASDFEKRISEIRRLQGW